MKRLSSVLAMLALTCSLLAAATAPRRILPFDSGWKFSLGDIENAQAVQYNDREWRAVTLPHDWSIEGENLQNNPGGGSIGYFPMGTGWYRKSFSIPGYSKSKIYTIEFDGVYMNSTVWINGTEIGSWPYGYSSFSYDITPVLKASGNVIAVRVDNSKQPNSRWYSGSGIYRHVRIVETGQTGFEKWGVFNYTESIENGKAVVHVTSDLANRQAKAVKGTVRQTVVSATGQTVATATKEVEIPAGGKASVEQQFDVADPILWSLDTPYLYTLRTSLVVSGREADRVENPMGIRTIDYDVDKGFLLNGKQVKMKGVNLHHDGGAVGAAVPERVWERRIEILKSGGCNAIRTAHNAPAPEFLDLCDRLGMLVMDEAFDQWIHGKNTYDYHVEFDEWHERDLHAMVARDRNHPSVVMWSVGNEIRDQHSEEGPGIARELVAYCHSLDPTRLVTSGNDEIASNNPASPEYLAEFANDIIGYNYPDRWRTRREVLYALDKAEFPERRVVATESGGYGGSRGQYRFPTTVTQPAPAAPQAAGNAQQPQGNQMMRSFRRMFRGGIVSSNLIDVEQRWRFTMAYDYVIGDFMWTGIDYYGESGWPSRGSTSGYLDNCGFKKDGYYFFKSIWSDEPMVHLLPHWNWEGHEGEIMQVACFTNCEEVELFVNGKSYGKKSIEFPRQGVENGWNSYGPTKRYATTADLHLTWDVAYEPGEIKAVGTIGDQTYEEIIRTAGAPARLRATVDRPSFRADPSDVAHVTVEVLDAAGNLCPITDNRVQFTVTGGRLIGVENGNMSDLESVKSDSRKAYSGMCLGIVAADQPGTVTVRVTSEGLTSDEISFKAR
ncbi:MAG: DUF4982 domain-containing protein [Bacteroidales bacterium]|nr:DUF4982 domain-containing protein [Bacteroidales bacterium]